METLVVLSPHCDDAVFGAGDFIATHPGAVVLTVFAGDPADCRLRAWDADCGFAEGNDVMARRRAEDADALACLRARPHWLPFRDDQYGRDDDTAAIAAVLEPALDAMAATTVALPLGLFHRDHTLASDAALVVAARRPGIAWLAYEDAIYRALPGDLVAARVESIRRRGFVMEAAALRSPASALKREAVARYASQLRGLASAGRAGHEDAFAPERWWHVRRA
jgi:LmbE family N-acetylglucosaminyl deacetylase